MTLTKNIGCHNKHRLFALRTLTDYFYSADGLCCCWRTEL